MALPQGNQQDMQKLYQGVSGAVEQYYRNPSMFSDDQVKQIKMAADQLGIPMSVQFSGKRALKKGLYELGEGLTLGLLPNSLDPGALNAGESIAGGVGGLLGLAAPIGIGLKAGSLAVKGARAVAAGEGMVPGSVGIMRKIATSEGFMGRAGWGGRSISESLRFMNKNLRSRALRDLAGRVAESRYLPWAAGVPAGLTARNFFEESDPEAVELQ